jgi:hypothetical protein
VEKRIEYAEYPGPREVFKPGREEGARLCIFRFSGFQVFRSPISRLRAVGFSPFR